MPARRCLLALCLGGLGLLMLPTCGRKTPVKPPELVAPKPIENLAARNVNDGIRMSWRRPTEYMDGSRMRDLGAFRIERSSNGAPFVPVATIAIGDQDRFRQERSFRWTDTDTEVGVTYQYQVISETTDDYVSFPSNIVTLERAIPTP